MKCPICNSYETEELSSTTAKFSCGSVFTLIATEPRDQVVKGEWCTALCDTCGHKLPHHVAQCAGNLSREKWKQLYHSSLYQAMVTKHREHEGQCLRDRNLINRLCNRIRDLELRIKSLTRQLESDDK